MEFHARQIAAPKYWQEFEDLCLDLFRRVWRHPTAQKNGRRGQLQNGTDISGNQATQEAQPMASNARGKTQATAPLSPRESFAMS